MTGILRIEARRNALLLLLPVSALLLWFSINHQFGSLALWTARSAAVQSSLQGLAPFVVGAAAWTASRDERRQLSDLLASTPRDPWQRTMLTAASTCGWALAAYLAATAVVFSLTAANATWGHPAWWPVAAGAAAIVGGTAVGHAAGRLVPSRFTAPLAALAVYALMTGTMEAALHRAPLGMLSPIYDSTGLNASVFYRTTPDLAVLQICVYLGLAVIGIGLSARPRLQHLAERRGPVIVTAVGLGLTTVAVAVAATARVTDPTASLAWFGTSATDSPVAYRPACSDQTPVRVCVHPAYTDELATVSTVVNQIAAPLAGLPGTPTATVQVADATAPRIEPGDPALLTLPDLVIHGLDAPADDAAGFRTRLALALVSAPGTTPAGSTPAQRALALSLLLRAHTSAVDMLTSGAGVTQAADELASLEPRQLTAWLSTHLAALRAGSLPLTDVP